VTYNRALENVEIVEIGIRSQV